MVLYLCFEIVTQLNNYEYVKESVAVDQSAHVQFGFKHNGIYIQLNPPTEVKYSTAIVTLSQPPSHQRTHPFAAPPFKCTDMHLSDTTQPLGQKVLTHNPHQKLLCLQDFREQNELLLAILQLY